MSFEYALAFKKKALAEKKVELKWITDKFEANGLVFEHDQQAEDVNQELIVLLITAKRAEMEREAERLQLNKLLKDKERRRGKTGWRREFTVTERNEFENIESEAFFLPCERQQIIYSLLHYIEAGDLGSRFFKSPEEKKQELEASTSEEKKDRGSLHHLVRRVTTHDPNTGSTLPLLEVCSKVDILESFTPLSDEKIKKKIWGSILWSFSPDIGHEVRDYYGEQVAYYFVFLQFFSLCLIPPGLVGCALWLYERRGTVTVDDDPWLPFYGFIIIIWAHFFIKYFSRACSSLACEWGALHLFEDHTDLRPHFKGEWQISHVTGLPEKYYPVWKRRIAYAFSFIVTVFMLCIAFTVMVCSFNLQGYMSIRSPFHVPFLHQFSNPGAIFDPNGPTVFMLMPVVFHVILIMTLNKQYRTVAEWLTELENHRTHQEHENALIFKRFLFEAFDCYIPLFYLAFYELDAELLKIELATLYTSDSIRRVSVEVLLPLATKWLNSIKQRLSFDQRKLTLKETPKSSPVLEEIEKEEYEQFDDYLEMVITYGYITLFASAFPLASFISIITNQIEFRSDAFKLTFVHRKPHPTRVGNIGTWFKLLTFMSWLSVLTNCFIFGFSSEQMGTWFPWLFKPVVANPNQEIILEAGNVHHEATEEIVVGLGRYVVGLLFGIEHVIIIVCLCIYFAVHDLPGWVRSEILRKEYDIKAERRKIREATRKDNLQSIVQNKILKTKNILTSNPSSVSPTPTTTKKTAIE